MRPRNGYQQIAITPAVGGAAGLVSDATVARFRPVRKSRAASRRRGRSRKPSLVSSCAMPMSRHSRLSIVRMNPGVARRGKLADPRRGAADRGQYRKAAYFATLRLSRDKRSGAVMTRPRILFNCPHCNALYQIVRTETGPGDNNGTGSPCRACARPLPAREGNFILKYFLLRKALRLGLARSSRFAAGSTVTAWRVNTWLAGAESRTKDALEALAWANILADLSFILRAAV